MSIIMVLLLSATVGKQKIDFKVEYILDMATSKMMVKIRDESSLGLVVNCHIFLKSLAQAEALSGEVA